ncbi:MAG: tRNA (adenosine(37)-N6)-threonylcarbamoyltransferase complex dimerization subunit type 1 TsaB [Clostridiaceae bacterium]|nr:tRNA (adenosine(37)-N6)-threonylcarbamoyltransferase complex dimerization subunit type 1 TsaB [Clostridiaceae bacterium]
MRILAFESSAIAASVAYWRDGAQVASAFQASGLTHSSTLLPMAQSLLANAGLSMADVDVLAVAHGPGSFTGLRIGVSLVKGLAFERDLPCVGVSTLEALANCMPRRDAVLCAVMDARAGQVYHANFDLSGEVPVRLCEDRAVTLAELREELSAIDRPVLLAGDGAHLLTDAGEPVPENLRLQNAYGVARLAARVYAAGGDFSAAALRPEYLRLPQAERERLAKMRKE